MKGTCRESSKTEAKVDSAMAISVAEETTTSSVGDNRACSNGRGRENKCSSGKGTETEDGGSQKRLLYDRGRQGEKLLCLWRFWAHGPSLQELRKRKSDEGKETGI